MRPLVLDRSSVATPDPVALDAAQAQVVDWIGPGTCVVLGGPGTGATTALVHAAVARLREVPAAAVLILVRDRDAVRRMRATIARSGADGGLPSVTTFHGLAYSLVRRTLGTGPDAAMPRLLSGAEEDVRIRDLLRGAIEDGELPWPGELLAATSTLGFANDLRALLARSRELGIAPERLSDLGRQAGIPAWEALARFAGIESEVMALEGVIDYGGLLELAIDTAPEWSGDLRHVYVDDFQEAGPAQRRLLRAITGPGTATVVAADPDVAAYGFRGGDRLGAMRLVEEAGADVIVLDRVHGGAGSIRTAYEAVRRQPALPTLAADRVRAYRQPQPLPGLPTTSVEVLEHDSAGDLVAWVADDLRRRHLGLAGGEPMEWDAMAVIARTSGDLEAVRRALDIAGIPVAIASADIPLRDEPAVAVLLAAVAAAIDPEGIDARAATDLISGPLLGLDPGDLRSLARALRSAGRAHRPDEPLAPGVDLVRDLLVAAVRGREDPLSASLGDDPRAAGARDRVVALGRMLGRVAAQADAGASPAEVLWEAWSTSSTDDDGAAWPDRLRQAALAGHGASGHDLDAVVALFATAERLSDRYAGVLGIRGLLAALSSQRVAAERISARTPLTPAVVLLTPHLAVGRGWEHVTIVGAQEGTWPPVLAGSSILRLAEWESLATGVGDAAGASRAAAADRIAQERRLFALAVSRARRSLHVCAVRSDSDQPSRFVDDIGVTPQRRPGRPPRAVTLDGMVARLRETAQDPRTPPPLRQAAVARLAVLADASDEAGRPLAPRADPDTWWGRRDVTPGVHPVRPPDRPLALSGSGLAGLRGCALRWFLSRVVRAEGPRGRALAIGSLVHALAEHAARDGADADADALLARLDTVWGELAFEAPWEATAERAEVAGAVRRLCAYLRRADAAVAVEHPFSVAIPLRDGGSPEDVDDTVVVRGAIDRIEVLADGRVRLIDFKTARTLPTGPAVRDDPQLGVYQWAIRHGALDGMIEDPEVAGAALVQLRHDGRGSQGPRIQEQPALAADESWLREDIEAAIARIRAEDFPAVASAECRTCPYVAACPAQASGREVLA